MQFGKVWMIACLLIVSMLSYAESISVVAGRSSQPYTYSDQGYGFEVKIVDEAMNLVGYEVEFLLQPLARAKITYEQGRVDGLMTINENYQAVKDSFLSITYITYRNVIVSLEERNMVVDTLADLGNHRVIAFQRATIALGDKFAAAVAGNKGYWEMNEQQQQVAMLFLGRTDLIVIDHQIFKYYRNRLNNADKNQPVVYHELFEPNHYKLAFVEQGVRDAFNQGIRELRATGRYQKIIDSYLSE